MTSIPTTSGQRTSRERSDPSVRSATSSAMPMATASLANSAGWMDIPAITIHEREPLIVLPMTSTSTSPTTLATYTSGARMRTHRWSVAITSRPSTMPIAMLTSCFFRYARGSSPTRSSRLDVADHTSRAPSTSSPAAASTSTQSTRPARTRDVVSTRTRGRAAVVRLIDGVPS